MASIQARHARGCKLGRPWTTFDGARDSGCSCKPVYHVATRVDGRLVRERIGRNRQQAARARDKIATAVAEGDYRPQPDIAFRDWGRRWIDSLERKPTTCASYEATIAYATKTFGDKLVRRLVPGDISRFSAELKEIRRSTKEDAKPLSDSTRAKHLRVLSACLSAAVAHGYAGRNVARELPKAERPRAGRKEAAYFLDDELTVLFAAVEPGVYHQLFECALKTGCRLGELLALTWADIDLTAAVLHVRRTRTDGHLGTPKSHERRDVDLTKDLVVSLGAWWGTLGKPADDALVFPGESPSGYLDPTVVLRRELYPAMVRAGVPREGPTGEKRTFHSFRHSFARVALEHGAELTWLSRHLGHSGTAITDTVYGHWGRAARKRQVKRLDGAFTV